VSALLQAITEPRYRAVMMALYAGGLRVSEGCRLRPEDIDSKRMLIHIRDGKGGRDRYTVLSARLLDYLRDYFRTFQPREWLFPGRTAAGHISRRSVHEVLLRAVAKSGIKKHVSPHTLRHSFATHLLECNTDVTVIRTLLGRSRRPAPTTNFASAAAPPSSPTTTPGPSFRDQLYRKDWVVYAKPPFGGPEQVFTYLGRYTHRVAISNFRLVALENGRVTFTLKDYADDGQRKTMTVSAVEFLRRFLLHVLPQGFTRIRHYGICAGKNVATKLHHARLLLERDGKLLPPIARTTPGAPWWQRLLERTGVDLMACPCCSGRLVRRCELLPSTPLPPIARTYRLSLDTS
jgi:hypothetical protein